MLDTAIDSAALQKRGAKITSFVASSNVDGGATAADLLVGATPQGGEILLLNGVSGQATAAERRKGFLDEIGKLEAQKSIKYDITEWTADWTRTEAVAATSSLLLAGHRFVGIFGANDQMALGAVEALRTSPLSQNPRPVIIGFDAVPEAIAAVKSGAMYATLAQDAPEMGRLGVEILAKTWDGLPVERQYLLKVTPIIHH